MSQDKMGPEAAAVKAWAVQLYGLALDDEHAGRIAADLVHLQEGAKAAGKVPLDAEPSELFRQMLLARDPTTPRRA